MSDLGRMTEGLRLQAATLRGGGNDSRLVKQPNQPLTSKVVVIDPVAIAKPGDTTYTLCAV